MQTDKNSIPMDAAQRVIITKVWPGQSFKSSLSHRCNLTVLFYGLYHCRLYCIRLITFPVVLFFIPFFSCLFNFILK